MPSAIRYSNDRTNPAGAIPVFLSSSPKAMPIQIFAGPTGVYSGPIPVYFASGAGTPPFGTDQGNPNNAVPVVVSGAANAMPVWDTAPSPPPLSTNTTPPSITPIGTVASGTLLTGSPGIWDNDPLGYDWQWTRNGSPILNATNNTYMTAVVDRGATIGLSVAADNAAGRSSIEPSSNTVLIMGPPVNVVAPQITPTTAETGDTLSLSNGNWTNNPTQYYYGWTRNGTSISGANTNSYTTQIVDEDNAIGGVVQSQGPGGAGVAVASGNTVIPTAPVEP